MAALRPDRFVTGFLLVLTAGLPTSGVSQSFLRNPGFEAEPPLDGWTTHVYGATPRIALDPEVAREGRRSLRVTADELSDTAFGQEITEPALEDDQLNRAFRGRIGFVFQNAEAQVFSPTVREEVAFGPLNLGLDRDEAVQRVDDVLALLDIADLADRAPYQLSGGQKKRVAIASVLAMNPAVLLFDEPTAALDPRSTRWLVELLAELRRVGKTIVVATHDLERVPSLAERSVVMDESHRVVRDGPTSLVLADRDLIEGVNLADRA